MAKKKINVTKAKVNSKVSDAATKLHVNPRNDYPVFSFRHACDNNCLLCDWQKPELRGLVKTFKTMESLRWNDIHTHSGLRYKKIDTNSCSFTLPDAVSPDVVVCEVRVGDKERLFGYRCDTNVFSVVWFDREHEVLPYHKQRA